LTYPLKSQPVVVTIISLNQNLLNHFTNDQSINLENIFIPNLNPNTKFPIKNQQKILNPNPDLTSKPLLVTNMATKVILPDFTL
jgi:hypothetical protein